MKVIVQGQGLVDLTQRDFVAAGGEGSVYAKGATAYKVYADPSRMLPLGKITELAAITNRAVIRPELVLLDSKSHSPVGYTMRFVSNAMPLCQIFTRAFREREGLDHAKMLKLIQMLRTLVADVHKAHILVVDLNELNYLVSQAHDEVYGIDVDSYQTRNYPATAIMPSIRDWSVQGNAFTEGSDWFSFGILAHQMFTGIHPYKGKHPTIHGLEERMRARVSVFDPAVTVPKVVYPPSVIPPGYRAWFKALFQGTLRTPPPVDPGAYAAVVVTRTVTTTAHLAVQEVAVYPDDLFGFAELAGAQIAWMRSGVWLDRRPVLGATTVRAVGTTPHKHHAVVAWVEGGELRLQDLTTQQPVPTIVRADDVMSYDGRIYVRSQDRILEVVLHDMGSQVIPTTRVAVNVLEHATRIFEGVALQDLLGSTFASVFPKEGLSYQVRVKELDAYRVVDAKVSGRVLMVVGTLKKTKGTYDRLTFLFNEGYDACALVRTEADVVAGSLNFLVLDEGTCVYLTEKEELEVWSVKDPNRVRVVTDAMLGNDMRLIRLGGRVGFIRKDKVFSMRMT